MRRPSAFFSILIVSLSAPITPAARLPVSLAATSGNANQGAKIAASPRGPTGSSTQPFILSNSSALRLPDANSSLSLIDSPTASVHFHIPNSPIDLDFTFFGGPLVLRAVAEIVELALDSISNYVILFPTMSITNGFFHQYHDGLEIRVSQYVDKVLTWYLLDLVLLGIQYHASQRSRPCELRFEIEIRGEGRVGHGSLWHVGFDRTDIAKRARINETPQQLSIASSVSTPTLTESNHSSFSSVPHNSHIIFSYHLFGPPIAEPTITLCFNRARQSIRTNIQRHRHDLIPNGSFEYTVDDIPIVISVEAYAGKEISWLLLDRILRDVSADIIHEHNFRECEFEFELSPFEEPHGHGYLEYSR